MKEWIDEWVTKVIVEQPRLLWVCYLVVRSPQQDNITTLSLAPGIYL